MSTQDVSPVIGLELTGEKNVFKAYELHSESLVFHCYIVQNCLDFYVSVCYLCFRMFFFRWVLMFFPQMACLLSVPKVMFCAVMGASSKSDIISSLPVSKISLFICSYCYVS